MSIQGKKRQERRHFRDMRRECMKVKFPLFSVEIVNNRKEGGNDYGFGRSDERRK